MKLDYTIEDPQERKTLVEQILSETPNPTPQYLEALSDYLVLCMEKQERRERKLLTENRMSTVTKREMSFEGLASQFENGEDGIYDLITNDKNVIFRHKIAITPEDLEEIPDLRQVKEAIEFWERRLPNLTGRDAYVAKQAIIDLRKDQYIIKNAIRKPITLTHVTHSKHIVELDSSEWVDADGAIQYQGVSLLDPKVCSAILCNYSRLKQNSYGVFQGDTYHLMCDFDRISAAALENTPLYLRLVELKIDGLQNHDIQKALYEEFGIQHSVEYISSLWRKKIPQMIAAYAEEEFLDDYYLNTERGKYKRCTRCGELKLATNKYFSKNRTSKDGFYSICKKCRNGQKSSNQSPKSASSHERS